jgi:hypothetical protein
MRWVALVLAWPLCGCGNTPSADHAPPGGTSSDAASGITQGAIEASTGTTEDERDAQSYVVTGDTEASPGDGTPLDAVAQDARAPTSSADDGAVAGDGAQAGASSDGPYADAAWSALPVTTVRPCATPTPGGSVLFDVGHAVPVVVLKQSGARTLSEDATGHWVLWDTGSRSQVLSGDAAASCAPGAATGCVFLDPVRPAIFTVDLAAGTVAVAKAGSIDLYASTDGHPLQTVSAPAGMGGSFGVSADGSYVWIADAASLTAWSTSGTRLLTRPGDYRGARIFAAPAELRVALGPAGPNVIELVATATGSAAKTPPFPDPFESWFLDGSRFITASRGGAATNVTIFAANGTQQDAQVLPFQAGAITGQGRYFSTTSNYGGTWFEVFPIGGNANPAFNRHIVGNVFASGNFIAVDDDLLTQGQDLIDLSGPSVAFAGFVGPSLPMVTSFAADSMGNWVLGSNSVLYSGIQGDLTQKPQPLNCGRVLRLAGSAAGRFAMTTEAGQLLVVDRSSSATSIVAAIAAPGNPALAMSDDGATLALAVDAQREPVSLFDLRAPLAPMRWQYAGSSDPRWVSLSADGTHLAIGALLPTFSFTRTLTTVPSPAPYFSETINLSDSFSPGPTVLSPSGDLAAWSDFLFVPTPDPQATTTILRGGRLQGTASGYPIGWLDESRLLMRRYARTDAGLPTTIFAGSDLCDTQGRVLSHLPLPPLYRIKPVMPDRIFAPDEATIYSLSDGSVAWRSPDWGTGDPGDIAGSAFVFALDHRVLAEAY